MRTGVAAWGPASRRIVLQRRDRVRGRQHEHRGQADHLLCRLRAGRCAAAERTRKSTLFVLDTVYGAGGGPGTAPRLIYYNNNASTVFGLRALIYNDNPSNLQLYALDTTANLWCYKVPQNPASPPLALTGTGNCVGWTADQFTTTGNNVTYSSPYPVYDGGSGDILRVYFTDDSGELSCVKLGETATPTAPAACFASTATPGAFAAGPPAVVQVGTNQFVVYFGDQDCNFYQALDNNGALTLNAANTACLNVAAGTNGACTGAVHNRCKVAGSPVLDFTNNRVYIATNNEIFEFPLATSAVLPAWAATKHNTMAGNADQPLFSTPAFDETNPILYVTADSTLWAMAYPLAGGAVTTSTGLFKAPTLNYTIDALTVNSGSMPLGSPFTYYSSVFVNTSFSGSTTANGAGNTAKAGESGCIEQYASGKPAVFEQVTTSTTSGTLIESGEIIDWSSGNIYYGYDKGNTNVTTSGQGGLVQLGASATVPNAADGWSCPNPPFSTSGSTCVYTAGTASTNCRTTADCTSNTNFGAGFICTNQGNNPGYACVRGHSSARANAALRGRRAPGPWEPRRATWSWNTDPSYGTCVACTSSCASGTICDATTDVDNGSCVECDSLSQSECTSGFYGASKTACDYSSTGTSFFDTCVQCSSNTVTTCTTTGLTACDTTSGSSSYDKCVQCAQNNQGTCTGSTAVCDFTSAQRFDTCVQCDAANTTACTGGSACDLTPTSPTFDTCVVCSPADGNPGEAPGNGCNNSAFPICDTYSGLVSCGQCTASGSVLCPSANTAQCGSDGHCDCDTLIPGFTCPAGSACNAAPGSFGECE